MLYTAGNLDQARQTAGRPCRDSEGADRQPVEDGEDYHLVSNVCVDEQSDDRGAGRFYLVAYRRDTSDPPPYPVPLPTVIGICHMTVVRGTKRWMFESLEIGPFLSAGFVGARRRFVGY